MSNVYILHSPRIAKAIPASWSLYRVGVGPGRGEGCCFKSKKEAIEFAKKYGHTVVKQPK